MMTTTELPDSRTDLRQLAAEASAEVVRISERIVAGETDVDAADLIAAEQEAERLRLAVERQADLERQGNLRRRAEQDRKSAEALAASLTESIRAGGGIGERLQAKQAAVRKAVAELVAEVDGHNDNVDQMLRQVAALRGRVNLADFGINPSPSVSVPAVGVAGIGHLGKVDVSEAVAAAVAHPLAEAPASDLTKAATSGAGTFQRHIGELATVAAKPLTRDEQLAAQERRRERGIRKTRQTDLEGQLRAIRSGVAASAATDVRLPGADPFPTTEEAFKAKYPDFVEGATYYEGPLR